MNYLPEIKSIQAANQFQLKVLLIDSTAILACFLFYAIIAVIWIALSRLDKRGCFNRWKKKKKKSAGEDNPPEVTLHSPTSTAAINNDEGEKRKAAEKKKTRLKSLDTFRG